MECARLIRYPTLFFERGTLRLDNAAWTFTCLGIHCLNNHCFGSYYPCHSRTVNLGGLCVPSSADKFIKINKLIRIVAIRKRPMGPGSRVESGASTGLTAGR